MTHIIWGLQRNITPRLGARLVQEGTGCTIWLTGPASPASSVTPNAGSWMKHSRTLSARWNRC
jgi:hypothetical protein